MRNALKNNFIQFSALCADILIVMLCVYVSMKYYGIYYEDFTGTYILYAAVILVFSVFNNVMMELYSAKAENVYHSVISVVVATAITYVVSFVVCYIIRFQRQTGMFWMVLFFTLEATMIIWRLFFAVLKKKFSEKRSMLIIENINNTSRLARKLKYASNEENGAWYHLIDETDEKELEIVINDILPKFDVVFISPHISKSLSTRLLYKAQSMGKEANILANVDAVTTLRGDIYQIDDTPVVVKKCIHLTRMQKFVKRCFDLAFSIVLAIVTAPVFAICAIAIKLDSKGPIFYKQERYTIHKKVFCVYKFRTMVVDAEKDGAKFATENDPRITRVGSVLRALRLDELPQIYNIIGGSMSVVGPRPERPVFADEFSKCVESYDLRYCLKAGLTGYAQVYGRYNTRVSDKILMDIIYGTTYSFLLDIKLILLTIKTLFIKSSTAGVDDENDINLSKNENETQRRAATLDYMKEYINKSDDRGERK